MPKRKGSALDADSSFRCTECNKKFEGRRALRIHASVCLPRSAALAAAPFQPSVDLLSDLPSEGLSPSQHPGRDKHFPDPRSLSEAPLEADPTQDSPYRGEHELNEAARFETVSGSQLPRSNTLAFRRQPEQQKHTLPCSALKLLPLLCEKSAVFSDKLLKVIKDKSFAADDIPWNSIDELHTFLDKEQVGSVPKALQHSTSLCVLLERKCSNTHVTYRSGNTRVFTRRWCMDRILSPNSMRTCAKIETPCCKS